MILANTVYGRLVQTLNRCAKKNWELIVREEELGVDCVGLMLPGGFSGIRGGAGEAKQLQAAGSDVTTWPAAVDFTSSHLAYASMRRSCPPQLARQRLQHAARPALGAFV